MRGRVASDEEAVEVTAGVFIQVRLIEWTNNPQPHIVDHKQYAASAGLVFEDSTAADSDTNPPPVAHPTRQRAQASR